MRFKLLLEKSINWENQNLWETDYRIHFIHCETDCVIRFIKKKNYETDYTIRFTVYETDCVIRFMKKFANFFMKRITQSVSHCNVYCTCITIFIHDFAFVKLLIGFQTKVSLDIGFRNLVHKVVEFRKLI